MKTVPFRFFALGALLLFFAFGGEGDEMLANYLELRTVEIEDSFLGEVGDKEDWNERKAEHRERLGYMLGLSPDRPPTDLKATITGKLEEGGEFWLRVCPCCKDIMVEEEGADVFELEHHDVEKGRTKKGMHNRGESLFADLQTHNSSNPAVTYG